VTDFGFNFKRLSNSSFLDNAVLSSKSGSLSCGNKNNSSPLFEAKP
jgi:hypothetical protein